MEERPGDSGPRGVLVWYRRARSALARLVLRLRPDADLTPFERFKRDGHASLLLQGLSLDERSVVLDIGGYLGDYTAAVAARYGCTVHVFEPVPAFAEAIADRFVGSPKVHVHAYALGEADATRTMHLNDDGTGAYASGEAVSVAFRSVASFAEELEGMVDVAAINIEGGEYELIPALATAGLLPRIGRLFIQFHDLGPDSVARREACRAVLRQTHRQVWDYAFVWEAWEPLPSARSNASTASGSAADERCTSSR